MKSVFSQKPCDTCCVDSQVGNPYNWERECDRCIKLGQWKNEALIRLSKIEDILGDEYDLDRLKELVQANREGKCVVMPCKPGDTVYYIGGLYNTLIKPVTVEEVYVGDGVFSIGVSSGFTIFTLQESEWYKTEKEAESALEKMKEGK